MSNSRKWTRTKSVSDKRNLQRYFDTLTASGMEEREVARAYLYAECFGLEMLTPMDDRCVIFDIPDCDDWNCLNPTHQIIRYE